MADKALEIVSMKNPADFGLDPNILAVGDRIVEVAGKPAEDQLDFHFHSSKGKTVSVRVQRKDGSEENILLPTRAIAGLAQRNPGTSGSRDGSAVAPDVSTGRSRAAQSA